MSGAVDTLGHSAVIALPACTNALAKLRALARPAALALRAPTIAICGAHRWFGLPATNSAAGALGTLRRSAG
jgi:hypothetical protein